MTGINNMVGALPSSVHKEARYSMTVTEVRRALRDPRAGRLTDPIWTQIKMDPARVSTVQKMLDGLDEYARRVRRDGEDVAIGILPASGFTFLVAKKNGKSVVGVSFRVNEVRSEGTIVLTTPTCCMNGSEVHLDWTGEPILPNQLSWQIFKAHQTVVQKATQ